MLSNKMLLAAPLAALSLIPAATKAQINYGIISEAENIDVEALVASGDYGATDGVAAGAGETLYAIHWTTGFNETLVRIDDHEGNGAVLRTDAQIVSDLGSPYGPSLTFAGGFVADTDANKLYFMDTFSGEYALLALDLSTSTAEEVLRGAELDDASDFALLPTGELIVVRGTDGIGYVDPGATTPAWTPVVSMADIQGVLGTTEDAPAEAVGVNAANGDVYVFCHDVLALVKIENILSGTPTITHLSALEDADLHDLVVDENGVVYAFNEAGGHVDKDTHLKHGGEGALTILAGSTVHSFDMGDIIDAVEGHEHSHKQTTEEFTVSLWRGMAVRSETDAVELFLACSTPDFGIVRVVFTEDTSVGNWAVYE